MKILVKERLDEYLEFNSKELFFDPMVIIFGGAIRDCIADQPINDVDILVGPKSLGRLEYLLSSNGYIFLESHHPKDLASIYSDLNVISEPRTWIKVGSSGQITTSKIVQLIRPTLSHKLASLGSSIKMNGVYKNIFNNLIENVDISCCGVSWNGTDIIENCKDAIIHCITKTFVINYGAAMNSNKRIEHRKAKFISRGWTHIDPTNISTSTRRDMLLAQLIEHDFEYIPFG